MMSKITVKGSKKHPIISISYSKIKEQLQRFKSHMEFSKIPYKQRW